jgi:hypothetical protein
MAETVGSLPSKSVLYALRAVDVYEPCRASDIAIGDRILDFLVLRGLLAYVEDKRKRGMLHRQYALTLVGRDWMGQRGGPFSNRDTLKRIKDKRP